MKKLMSIAAAALCGAAFAADGITSANIVGYQNKSVGGFDMVVNTFRQIGVEEANMKLGAIGANSVIDSYSGEVTSGWDMNNDYILLYDASGKALGNFFYLPQTYIDIDPETYAGSVAGWYKNTFFRASECMNDYVLPFGCGILVKAKSGTNPQLTFNGDVKTTAHDIDVGAFTIAGNSSPVDLTLGKITVNSVIDSYSGEVLAGWDMNNDYILLYDANGKALGNFFNLPQTYLDIDPETYGKSTAGWYKNTFFRSTECMNDYALPAGAAFLVKAKSGVQPVLTLPSPIKTAE